MKRLNFLLIHLVLFISLYAKPVRVACIGNSITYGAGIQNREKNSYPAQLQAYLGDGYVVRNFGLNGSTCLYKGNNPYLQSHEFKESLKFQPDIVLIKLGTNDSKGINWKYSSDFQSDYQTLIDAYQGLDSKPRVILLTPLRCYLPANSVEINNQIIEKEIRPVIEKIARANGLEIINLFNLLGEKWESYLMPDRLHPSSIGAGMIAEQIYRYLSLPVEYACKELKEGLKIKEGKEFNFHGYKGIEFFDKGVKCFLVQPSRTAVGKPWLLRARFWDHEPQTDIALLENGFHIAYCDVANKYGSDEAIERWNHFYKRMVKAGFSNKVVLEGMSRGGLIVYNWASRNPGKVACIYADAPVMDFKSWPLGKGKSKGSLLDTQQLFAAYGFSGEKEALSWNKNPIDHVNILAKAGIPILHVVGDEDKIVPICENTSVFEQRMKMLRSPISVIHKPGVGHHPHSLSNPGIIVDFILTATHRDFNACIHAVPGNEYRSAAGWAQGWDWHKVADEITEKVRGRHLRLLLLGNSITQGWGGSRLGVVNKPGKRILDEVLGDTLWESAGISGDRTQNLLWRIRYSNYETCYPQNAVITIGINNLMAGDSPEQVVDGIMAVVDETRKRLPNTKIVLLGGVPAGKGLGDEIRMKCDEVHHILSKRKTQGVHYVNPTLWFVDEKGDIRPELYGGDYIHLTQQGYKVWATELKKILTQ